MASAKTPAKKPTGSKKDTAASQEPSNPHPNFDRTTKKNPLETIEDVKVIRSIHSNCARRFSRFNFYFLIVTIIIAVIVTFIGFTGAEVVAGIFFNGQAESSEWVVKFVMDLMTLAILVSSILGLIFRFEAKMHKHYNAVTKLTEFISEIEFKYDGKTDTFSNEDVKIYALKYKYLMQTLPSTSDSDYYKALKTMRIKRLRKAYINSDKFDNANFITRWWTLLWI